MDYIIHIDVLVAAICGYLLCVYWQKLLARRRGIETRLVQDEANNYKEFNLDDDSCTMPGGACRNDGLCNPICMWRRK
jgi:hypothetical protein